MSLTDVLDFHPTEVARQMTLMDSAMLKAIEVQEWMGLGWTKKDGRSPNLVAFIERFNLVSAWVATVVLTGTSVDQRCSVLRFFVLVAQECLNLNNFNGCLEIIAGLANVAVARLSLTWTALSPTVQKQVSYPLLSSHSRLLLSPPSSLRLSFVDGVVP